MSAQFINCIEIIIAFIFNFFIINSKKDELVFIFYNSSFKYVKILLFLNCC